MKRKKTVEIPEREETVPDGFYMIKIGDSRVMFDAYGNPKPPAEVRTMKRPKKVSRPKRSRLGRRSQFPCSSALSWALRSRKRRPASSVSALSITLVR